MAPGTVSAQQILINILFKCTTYSIDERWLSENLNPNLVILSLLSH